MNIQQQESNITSMLIKCLDTLSKNGIRNKHTKLFEHNFKLMYNDINNLKPLNESFQEPVNEYNIVLNNKNNMRAYCSKVLRILKSEESTVYNLNENFKLDDASYDDHDIRAFAKYIKKLIKFFDKQNDLQNIQPNVLSIKRTLRLPIRISGMDITKIPQCDTALFDGANNNIILITFGEKPILYNIDEDEYRDLSTITNDTSFVSKLNMANTLQFFKFYCHPNIVVIYQNMNSLNLKYTDNLYKDQAQKSHLADIEKQKELQQSYQYFQNLH